MNPFDTLINNHFFQQTRVAKELQKQALGFIDIGARGGAHFLVEPIAVVTAVLGFEPDLEEYQRLLNDHEIAKHWAKFSLEPVALADKVGDAELHLLSAPTNHSLRAPNTGFTTRYNMVKWQEVGTWPLKTELLDTILFGKRKTESYWGELIKIDTQGTEYEILAGSVKTLQERTVAVISEVSFCELYQGQKLFSELELFLRNLGFSFYGFHSFHSRSLKQLNKADQVGIERAMYADAVFFKDPLPGSISCGNLTDRQLQILFVCALLLKYYDFALELAIKTWALHDSNEIRMIKELITQLSTISCETTVEEVLQLAKQVNGNPARANILAGKFSDKRRIYFDYDDISF